MLLRSSSAPASQTIFTSFSCNSSPIYSSKSEKFSPKKGVTICQKIRRAQSDSNLEGLAFPTSFNIEEVYNSRILRSGSIHNHQKPMLHTEPSFSIYHTGDHKSDENKDLINGGNLERSTTIGGNIESQFSFGGIDMLIIKEDDNENEEVEEDEECVGGGSRPLNFDDNGDLEKYYIKMVHDDPSNALVLRNYAQFLESKRDLTGAEEFYSRATLADPKDGEILSRYAKLVWDLHRDQAKASTYFERAVEAAPQDCHVHAAYASFLWETDENEETDDDVDQDRFSNNQVDEYATVHMGRPAMDFKEENRPSSPPLHLAMGLGLNMSGFGGGNNTDEYVNMNEVEERYRMLVDENPSNTLFLRNYAQFLHKSRGDLRGAEEYYSRAILVDPSDGQILSLYADIVWELHRDRDRAVAYFERAVQATPADSNVLAAYAKFLWETEDDEDVIEESYIPVAKGAAMA